MFTLSAFADEISPNPAEQIAMLQQCGIRFIEFRSIEQTNVLLLSEEKLTAFKTQLDAAKIGISAIGSPIGKIRIDEAFEPHVEKFRHAIKLCRMFGTRNIRIFSYYPPEKFDGNWAPYRDEVLRRMKAKVAIAEAENIQLFHENEHRIYGDAPERVADLFANIVSPNFKAAMDPANFVYGGFDPLAGWAASKPHTTHFHIKDWKYNEHHGSIAGEGDGQFLKIFADAEQMGYQGFAVMEPHLMGGGPTGGVTGPELFPKAVEGFRKVLNAVGGKWD